MIGVILVQGNQVALSSQGGSIHSHLNGSTLMKCSSSEFDGYMAPVISMIVSELKGDKSLEVWGNDDGMGLINKILKYINTYPEAVKLLSLSNKPDEMTINTPPVVLASDLMGLMEEYRKHVKQISSSMSETQSLAGALLRTELPGTMWGANKIHGALNSIRGNMNAIQDDLNHFEMSAERTDKSADMFRDFMPTGKIRGKSATKLADNVIEDFHVMKQAVSKTSQALYALFSIDPLCKKYTGYPTTWFFDSSIYYDFLYEFENLIRNLILTTKAERGVMAPLASWKNKTLGEN